MSTDVIYDEAEPFQVYSPALHSPLHDIYSNSGEFDVAVEHCGSDDGAPAASVGAVQQQLLGDTTPPGDTEDDKMSSSCSGTPMDVINSLDEVVREFEAKQEGGSAAETPRDVPASWNVRLRNNWKRKLRRDAAAATEQKYKKSDNRQTITGSLSRLVRWCELPRS